MHKRTRRLPWLLAFVVFVPAPAGATILVSRVALVRTEVFSAGTSDRCGSLGTPSTTGVCSSSLGGPTTPFEGRAAARAQGTGIASNGQFIGRQLFPGQSFNTSSAAQLNLLARNIGPAPVPLEIDFALAPSFLEITDNAEVPMLQDARIFADLIVFYSDPLAPTQVVLRFEWTLSGDYLDIVNDTASLTKIGLTSDVGLDLGPLANPSETRSSPGPLDETLLYDFPAFGGRVSLGTLAPGATATVEYTLETEVAGTATRSSVIAAINDPFDATGGGFVEVVGGIVPEPRPTLLLALAIGKLVWGRRRSGPRARQGSCWSWPASAA